MAGETTPNATHVTVNGVDVTCTGFAQVALDVILHCTCAPLAALFNIKLEPVKFVAVPVRVKLHRYEGLSPPFVVLAVNPTVFPLQDVCEIVMAGTTAGFIVIELLLEVIVTGLAQARVDVITQLTTCPLVREFEVNVGLLLPTLFPFTFH